MMMHLPKTTQRWRLIEARKQRSWSQQEIADRIGTTKVNLSRWERGITKPGPYYRRKLCALFGKSEEELDLVPTVNGTNVDEEGADRPTVNRENVEEESADRATIDRTA